MAKSDDLNFEKSLDDALNEGESDTPFEQSLTHAFTPNSNKSTDQLIQKYSHCEFCGARLHFNYVTDFSRNTTQEKAGCPECGLEARQLLHRLQ